MHPVPPVAPVAPLQQPQQQWPHPILSQLPQGVVQQLQTGVVTSLQASGQQLTSQLILQATVQAAQIWLNNQQQRAQQQRLAPAPVQQPATMMRTAMPVAPVAAYGRGGGRGPMPTPPSIVVPVPGSQPTAPQGQTVQAQAQAQAATQAQNQAQQAQQQKKRKPEGKSTVPDKVSTLIPDSHLFNCLVEYDKRVTDLLNHRKADLREAMQGPERVKKVLRLYIFHQHYHQDRVPILPPPPIPQASMQAQHAQEPQQQLTGPPGASSALDILMEDAQPTEAEAAASSVQAQQATVQLSSSAAGTTAGSNFTGGGGGVSITAASRLPAVQAAKDPAMLVAPQEDPPSWSLHIVGRFLDTPAAGAGGTAAPAAPQPATMHKMQPMLYYFKRVEIKMQPVNAQSGAQQQQTVAASSSSEGTFAAAGAAGAEDQGAAAAASAAGDGDVAAGEAFVWERAHVGAGGYREGIELRRIGSTNIDMTITLEQDWQPERYMLPPVLAQLLGVSYETRARVLSLLWPKLEPLMDSSQPHVAKLTPQLQQLFGCPQLSLKDLGTKLESVLQPMPPLVVQHTVRLDGPSVSTPDVYDVTVELPSFSPGDRLAAQLEPSAATLTELEGYDVRIKNTVQKVNEHRRRRAMLLGFGQDPVAFIHGLAATQARDLRVTAGPGGSIAGLDAEWPCEAFRGKWVEDAVTRYVQKKLGIQHGY